MSTRIQLGCDLPLCNDANAAPPMSGHGFCSLLDLFRDMQEIDVAALVAAIDWIEFVRTRCATFDQNSIDSDRLQLTKQQKEDAKAHLGVLVDVCKKLGLRNAESTANLAYDWFKTTSTYTPDSAVVHLQHVATSIVEQLSDIRFFGLAADRSAYYDNFVLFGLQCIRAFPSATVDIRDSLRCLALEANTATVFHLMRVAEFGLRALARDRSVQIPKTPIELASWEQMIRELEVSEEKIHTYPRTLARERQYEFYHGALMEVRRFKNVWRNNIMHAREDYDRDQALSVFNHVRAFMNILASQISETSNPMPEIWT